MNGLLDCKKGIAPESDGMGESRRAWGPRRQAHSRRAKKDGAIVPKGEMVILTASGSSRELSQKIVLADPAKTRSRL